MVIRSNFLLNVPVLMVSYLSRKGTKQFLHGLVASSTSRTQFGGTQVFGGGYRSMPYTSVRVSFSSVYTGKCLRSGSGTYQQRRLPFFMLVELSMASLYN